MPKTNVTALVQRPQFWVRPGSGRAKLVTMPIAGEVSMGLRDEIAEHYKVSGTDLIPHATTLDYFIGASAACLTGTLVGMLTALGQQTTERHFQAYAEGVIVSEAGRLRIQSIHVAYRLKRDPSVEEAQILRAHDRHHKYCPIAASIGSAIEITSELSLAPSATFEDCRARAAGARVP